MELTWLMRLRIAGAMAAGVILIGILCWPFAAPAEPAGVVLAKNITFGGAVILACAAFVAGFIGYFVSWPYGREIGILAAPSGLAVWAMWSGSVGTLMQLNPTITRRQELFGTLKWEPVFWLFIVAVGFVGVLAGQRTRSKAEVLEDSQIAVSKPGKYLNGIIAIAGSVLAALFCIGILAQDVKVFDGISGYVMGQPAIGQIVFGVLAAFGFVAFLAKVFLDVNYIWSSIATSLVTMAAVTIYCKPRLLEHLVESWPAVFFSNSVISILPVQMVAFGTLGSIAGYWLAVRYTYWRKEEAD